MLAQVAERSDAGNQPCRPWAGTERRWNSALLLAIVLSDCRRWDASAFRAAVYHSPRVGSDAAGFDLFNR